MSYSMVNSLFKSTKNIPSSDSSSSSVASSFTRNLQQHVSGDIRSSSLLWHSYWHPSTFSGFLPSALAKSLTSIVRQNTQNVILHIQKCYPCASSASCESYHTYVSMLFPCLVDFWSSFCVKPWTFRPSFHLFPPNFPLKPLQDVIFGPWKVQCWQPQSSNCHWSLHVSHWFHQNSQATNLFSFCGIMLLHHHHHYCGKNMCIKMWCHAVTTDHPLQGIASVVASLTRKWVGEVRLEEGNLGKKL